MINVSELSFAYGRGKDVLSGLNTNLKKGSVYGLLGKNGVGKSTLLKLLCGLLFPKEGSVVVGEHSACSRRPSLLSELFFVTEELEMPTVSMRKYANLTASLYPNFSHELLEKYMREFQVSMDDKLSKMSHGQRKKAIVSYGLACNTKILIMDEPTNGMDIPSKSQFRKVISELDRAEKCVIISTHQVRDLDGIIDSILLVEGSSLIVDCTVEHIGKKFQFAPIEEVKDALYVEPTLRGVVGMAPNSDNVDNKADIEIFFNAVTTNQQAVIDVLNR